MNTITAWQNASMSDRIAIYDNYIKEFDDFGFFSEPISFEEFDKACYNSTFEYIQKFYKRE